MNSEYKYATIDEETLDELLSGRRLMVGSKVSSPKRFEVIRKGFSGAIWAQSDDFSEPNQPLAIISHEDDIRRLCGRYAQLRDDLSPLTAWCHLLTPRFLEALDSLVKFPNLNGFQASWTGLVVAEALLLAERPIGSLRLSACFATQSYAIARASALWSHISADNIVMRFDKANRLCRNDGGGSRLGRLRSSLEPIWSILLNVCQGPSLDSSGESLPILEALRALHDAREANIPTEALSFVRPLLEYVPEAQELRFLENLTPEDRLRLFDKIVAALSRAQVGREQIRRNSLALLAGYLSTVAAGGSPSLSLAESHAFDMPEITAWAYVVGGIGERVLWTSSFDGMGRLVARELMRPFRLDEPPTCDFSLDEAEILADPGLTDPLVRLRIKQARLVNVSLLPGVNVSIPLTEMVSHAGAKLESQRSARLPDKPSTDPLAIFADAIWPHLLARIDERINTYERDSGRPSDFASQRSRGKRKADPQNQLPLDKPKNY